MEGTDEVIARAGRLAGARRPGREGGQAEAGHAVRRAGDRRRHYRAMTSRRGDGDVDRCGTDAGDRRRARLRAPPTTAGIAIIGRATERAAWLRRSGSAVIGVGHLGTPPCPDPRIARRRDSRRRGRYINATARRRRWRHGRRGRVERLSRAACGRRSTRSVVAVPTELHHDVALPFLERGNAVLVEKPMARTLAEADESDRGRDERPARPSRLARPSATTPRSPP